MEGERARYTKEGRWTRRSYRERSGDDDGLESQLWAWAMAHPQTYDVGRAFVVGAGVGFAREKGLLDGLLGDGVPTVAAHKTVTHAAAPAPTPDTFWDQVVAWIDPSDPVYPEMLKYGLIGAGAEVMKQWTLPNSQGSQRGGARRKTRRRGEGMELKLVR
jgi:hypothetical protein